ncbi:flavin reductase family protein [Pseudoclavibacter helvolus]|uniref:Flavin reductase (DIM6/NTAB) family NADH-FMN oxidoreductase RutF n=1 Tax=Pseudoclavibacter helvolus TaxID=255205 RepID=A0A7W4UL44_9MICO|nr:flavin reductase family protein [Pseudoclavibacter helvolus]MBB2956469.1 flavin reductase (DIM6/NTAB) family NADH-FMN oxidoreductase RutF [Pseudoclavibacter helvolus]
MSAETTSLVNHAQIDQTELSESFRSLFRQHPSGVAVLTAESADGPVAMTITSLTSVNASPALVAFSLSKASSATPGILSSSSILVHFIDEASLAVAQVASTSGVDRFADRDSWGYLPSGEPHYKAVQRWARGSVRSTLDVDGAVLVVLDVVEARDGSAESAPEDTGVVYRNRVWRKLGAPHS